MLHNYLVVLRMTSCVSDSIPVGH